MPAHALSKEKLPTKADIESLQDSMVSIRCDMPEAKHHFTPGIYGREFAMPAGMCVVGKRHKHQHLMMVLSGRAVIVTENGRTEVSAPHISVSEPSAKRVVFALEDTVFVTVHHNPEDTLDVYEIEENHIEDEGFVPELHIAADSKPEELE